MNRMFVSVSKMFVKSVGGFAVVKGDVTTRVFDFSLLSKSRKKSHHNAENFKTLGQCNLELRRDNSETNPVSLLVTLFYLTLIS